MKKTVEGPWGQALPCLAWLTSPQMGLACTSQQQPAVVAGAGKASEADARRGEPSKPRPGAYKPCASGTITFGNISGNLHPKKKNDIFGCFLQRNPPPGSDSARHLEPDALILARFGAVKGQISHKTHFSENCGATF